ncbi:preprotein translocase subunit YajC [Pedobacter sp. UYP24]
MELNYTVTAIFLILIIALIIFLIRRNGKDESTFEKEVIDSEKRVEKHDNDHV